MVPIQVSIIVAPTMFGGEVGGRDSGAWMERLTTGDAGLHGSAIIFVNLCMRALDVALASLAVILGICGLFACAGSMLMWSRRPTYSAMSVCLASGSFGVVVGDVLASSLGLGPSNDACSLVKATCFVLRLLVRLWFYLRPSWSRWCMCYHAGEGVVVVVPPL
jgi:hypothetical protein